MNADEARGFAAGGSRCPICYDDKPHSHNAIEAVEMRGLEFPATNEAWLRYAGRTLNAALINELDFLFKKARRALTPQPQPSAEDVARLVEAARLGVSYDELLRSYSGPLNVLCEGDEVKIDRAYDAWVSATRAALAAFSGEK